MLRASRAGEDGGSSEAGAAPVLTGAKLANAGLVDPLSCGDCLVGLSGIYAAVNAIRLAVADKRQLTGGDVHVLMTTAFTFLSNRLTPLQAFASGCRISVWRGMAQAMVEAARRRLDLNLRLEPLCPALRDRGASFAVIEGAILHWRPVMMLCRGGRYTVVSGFTPSSLLLFDSGGACWLLKHACGVPGDAQNTRHLLIPGSLMALSA